MAQRDSRKRRKQRQRAAAAVDAPAPDRAPEQQAPEGGMARGYARGRAKDDAARAALKPLGEGERPLAVTIAGVVALVFGLANLVPTWRG